MEHLVGPRTQSLMYIHRQLVGASVLTSYMYTVEFFPTIGLCINLLIRQYHKIENFGRNLNFSIVSMAKANSQHITLLIV